ncbi:EMC3/TMCO1 family protein [Nanoarchaeota archaeon]
MVFESILDPVFRPLLSLEPFWTILILAFGITMIITLAYKYFTDQDEMKRLKDQMKKYQKQIRELQKTDAKKALDIQQKAMKLNMEYMKHSFRPTIYTFIPIIIIFGWMNANLVYIPLQPDTPFTVTAMLQEGLDGDITLSAIPGLTIDSPTQAAAADVKWTLQGDVGEYTLVAKYNDIDYKKDLLISSNKYASVTEIYEGAVNSISLDMKKVRPFGGFSIFGWNPGWLGGYILLSIGFSLGLRKVLKIV